MAPARQPVSMYQPPAPIYQQPAAMTPTHQPAVFYQQSASAMIPQPVAMTPFGMFLCICPSVPSPFLSPTHTRERRAHFLKDLFRVCKTTSMSGVSFLQLLL